MDILWVARVGVTRSTQACFLTVSLGGRYVSSVSRAWVDTQQCIQCIWGGVGSLSLQILRTSLLHRPALGWSRSGWQFDGWASSNFTHIILARHFPLFGVNVIIRCWFVARSCSCLLFCELRSLYCSVDAYCCSLDC